MEALRKIGEEIKRRRRLLNIAQNDLAEIAGISLRSLKDIETGAGNPGINNLEKVLEVLGLELKVMVK